MEGCSVHEPESLDTESPPEDSASSTKGHSVPEPESPNTETPTDDSAADIIMGEILDNDDNNDGLSEVQVTPNHEVTDDSDVPNDSVVPEISDNLNNNSSNSSSILEADTKRKSPRRKRTKKDEIQIVTV